MQRGQAGAARIVMCLLSVCGASVAPKQGRCCSFVLLESAGSFPAVLLEFPGCCTCVFHVLHMRGEER